MSGIYDFTAQSLAGEEVPLKRFEGQVLLIVNTASACGFTPQYKGLEHCTANSRRAALRCSDFPATSSARRSRATPRQIEAFCESKYDVTFPMFAKIDVNGGKAHPLYQYLKNAKVGPAGLVDQMEFHQIPGRSFGQGGGAPCADRDARRTEKRNRGTAVNEKNETMSDQFPDRLSTNPSSPYYNEELLSRDVGIRFKGVEKTNVEEYCISEGWIRVTAGNAKDRYGNPLTIKVHGPVEPYFRDKASS